MLIAITHYKGITPFEKDIIDGQFPENPKGAEPTATTTTIKVSTTFLDNKDVLTPHLQKQFFESLAKKVTDRTFETIGEQETSDVNVLILVSEFALLHCIVSTLQDANIKCWVYSDKFGSFIETPNYK